MEIKAYVSHQDKLSVSPPQEE